MNRVISKYLTQLKKLGIALGIRVIRRWLRILISAPWEMLIQIPSIIRALLFAVHIRNRYLLLVGNLSRTFYGNSLYFALEAHRNSNWLTFWVCHSSQFWSLYRKGFIPVLKGSILERWLVTKADVVAYNGYYRGCIGNYPTNAIKLLLWHGLSLKGVGLQCRPIPDDVGENDFTISTSPFTANIMSNYFGLPLERIFITGEPETDGIFKSKHILEECLNIPLKTNSKIVLYLPTWRENFNKIINGEYAPNNKLIEKEIKALFNDHNLQRILIESNAVMVTKLHPHNDIIINDVQQSFYLLPNDASVSEMLMSCADVLISDYSGALVDWFIMEKPTIAYAFDLDDYIEGRGIPNFDYKKVFSKIIVRNRKELAKRLQICLKDPESLKETTEHLAKLFHTHRSFGASNRILTSLEKLLAKGHKGN